MMAHCRVMADVTKTISIDGGPVAGGMLESMLRGESVQVARTSPDVIERRDGGGIGWSADTQNLVTTLVATGSGAAITAAVAAIRKRLPKAEVKVDDQDAPDDGGFLG